MAAGCLPTRAVGPEEDWKSAFRGLGFDPEAPGCGVFAVVDNVYAYPIPPEMRGAEWIYLRVDGFGFGCDSCIAGYALLRRT